jgi:hypothetical protein
MPGSSRSRSLLAPPARRLGLFGPPRPGVAEPQGRQYQRSCLRPAVAQTDLDQNVARRSLGVLDEHVEITVFDEDTGIDQFVLRVSAATPSIGFDEISVRVSILRIFIKILHVGVSRSAVEVIIVFLDVLPVIALAMVRPKSRSFRIGSLPFHKARAKHSRWWSSLIPARPSSPQ